MKTMILSANGREETTRTMLAGFERQNPGEPYELSINFGDDPIGDFWFMLAIAARSGEDLLALEDDVITARNFVRYVARWSSPHMTSFFFMGGGGLATGRPESPRTFGGNQALWFPAHLLRSLMATPPHREPGWLQDNALAFELGWRGELVWYHRPSLVQHMKGPSIAAPGRKWHPDAADFAGEAFDCLSLL